MKNRLLLCFVLMEDVSSMAGLGWNLNAGGIMRTLRGCRMT
ncbi:MAG: hypothetical protein NTU98_09135 [Bacteroidetes bacterium]|nr:hypothetical protein [Bacteroidota bacterium]